MRPKGKLFALLAVFAAIGIVTATGAFTTVSAERTVNVNVTGDASALLAMEPNATSANGGYASMDGTDVMVDISESNDNQSADATTEGNFSGSGVNDNATTTMDYVINITNQGTQPVEVSATYGGVDGFRLYNASDPTADLNGSAVRLEQGESMSVGVYVNTTANGGFTDQSVDVTIEANAVN